MYWHGEKMIWLGGWGIQKSPSSRAKCGYCYKYIPHGEMRIAIPGGGHWNTLKFHHVECWEEKVERTAEYLEMDFGKAKKAAEAYHDKIVRDRVREITREAKSRKLRIGP